ncbi:MAG: zinc ribbon domain-containing protein [Acidobacteriota bacterium]|jgi:putative FmdB family regulatory protein|nr:zinc ribbon domain-containing protein [Acidobacteriota bacterium]
MPIFEYRCQKCDSEFEKLVFGADADVHCPGCDSVEVEKLYSAFSGVARAGDGSTRPITSSGGCASCGSSNCSTCGGH